MKKEIFPTNMLYIPRMNPVKNAKKIANLTIFPDFEIFSLMDTYIFTLPQSFISLIRLWRSGRKKDIDILLIFKGSAIDMKIRTFFNLFFNGGDL